MDWQTIFTNSLTILGHGALIVFPYTASKNGLDSDYTPPNIFRKIKCHIYWLIGSAFICLIIAKGFDELGTNIGLNKIIPYFITIYGSAALGLNEAFRMDKRMTENERREKMLKQSIAKDKSNYDND